MDPVSIFGTTATIVAISLQLGSAIQSLAQLKIKVSSADLTVHSLIRRLSVIQYAIKDIRAWDDDNRTPSPASIEFKDALSVSLDGCSTILQSLNEQISQIHTDGEFTHWQKGKFVWKESLLKDYLGYLDGEIQALNLLLNSHQCRTNADQCRLLNSRQSREILNVVKEDTASLRAVFRSGESTSTARSSLVESVSAETSFTFDQDLFSSHVYQRRVQQLKPARLEELVQQQKQEIRDEVMTTSLAPDIDDTGDNDTILDSTGGPHTLLSIEFPEEDHQFQRTSQQDQQEDRPHASWDPMVERLRSHNQEIIKACDEAPMLHKKNELIPLPAASDLAESEDDKTKLIGLLGDSSFKTLYNNHLVKDRPDEAPKSYAHNFAHNTTENLHSHNQGIKKSSDDVPATATTVLNQDSKGSLKAFGLRRPGQTLQLPSRSWDPASWSLRNDVFLPPGSGGENGEPLSLGTAPFEEAPANGPAPWSLRNHFVLTTHSGEENIKPSRFGTASFEDLPANSGPDLMDHFKPSDSPTERISGQTLQLPSRLWDPASWPLRNDAVLAPRSDGENGEPSSLGTAPFKEAPANEPASCPLRDGVVLAPRSDEENNEPSSFGTVPFEELPANSGPNLISHFKASDSATETSQALREEKLCSDPSRTRMRWFPSLRAKQRCPVDDEKLNACKGCGVKFNRATEGFASSEPEKVLFTDGSRWHLECFREEVYLLLLDSDLDLLFQYDGL